MLFDDTPCVLIIAESGEFWMTQVIDLRFILHLLVVSHFGFLGQHHALYWNLATMGAVKYAPQGQFVSSVLELMLGPRSHEQDVA
jgi:hypothetical protein